VEALTELLTARAPSRASVRTPRALVHAFCQCSAESHTYAQLKPWYK